MRIYHYKCNIYVPHSNNTKIIKKNQFFVTKKNILTIFSIQRLISHNYQCSRDSNDGNIFLFAEK